MKFDFSNGYFLLHSELATLERKTPPCTSCVTKCCIPSVYRAPRHSELARADWRFRHCFNCMRWLSGLLWHRYRHTACNIETAGCNCLQGRAVAYDALRLTCILSSTIQTCRICSPSTCVRHVCAHLDLRNSYSAWEFCGSIAATASG